MSPRRTFGFDVGNYVLVGVGAAIVIFALGMSSVVLGETLRERALGGLASACAAVILTSFVFHYSPGSLIGERWQRTLLRRSIRNVLLHAWTAAGVLAFVVFGVLWILDAR